MAQSSESPRDRASMTRADLAAIEKGWSVYDSLERPIGNVTDVEAGQLRIDGRPEGLGFLEVPLESVRSAGDGDVRLSTQMEAITGTGPTQAETTTHVGTPPSTRSRSPVSSETSSEPTREHITVTSAQGRETTGSARPETGGSSYTASGTPVGLGSNTPVGDEPSSFRAWEDEAVQESAWSRYGTWLGAALVAVLGLAGYAWWRRRQAPRTPIERVRHAFETAGESVEPAWEVARERPRAVGLASLVGLLLLRYLLSSGEDDAVDADDKEAAARRVDAARRTAGDAASDSAKALKETGRALKDTGAALKDRLTERLPDGASDESVYQWRYLVPVVAAGGAALYALRARGRSGNSKTLGEIMTPQVQVLRPDATLMEAATMMKSLNVGALPVCDGRRLQGMVTDRDIVVRAIADGRDPASTRAGDIMSGELVYAFEDDAAEQGARMMRQHQIRRLPIVDRNKNLVGIVSLGDLAVDVGSDELSGETLEKISS